MTCAFTKVAMHASAARGIASERASRWVHLDVNLEDPVELALASDLEKSALTDVAESLCGKYTVAGGLPCDGCGDEEVRFKLRNL